MPSWPYSWKNSQEPTIKDDIKRPPLVGPLLYQPEGLHDLPWSKTFDAYGAATLTPYYIEGLASQDPGDQQFANYGLYSATTHQGSVYPSSKMAIPFLVEMLEVEKEHEWIGASFWLARIAVGEHHFIRTPEDAEWVRTIYFEDVYQYKEQLLAFYRETDNLEILRLLCFFDRVLPDYLDFGEEVTTNGEDPKKEGVFASKLVAQGYLAAARGLKGHQAKVKKWMRESPSLLVRGGAAICLAHSGLADKETLKLLVRLGKKELPAAPWVWDDFSELARKAWFYAASLDDLLEQEYFGRNIHLTQVLKKVFPPRADVSYLPSGLSPKQKKVLEILMKKGSDIYLGYELSGLQLPRRIIGIKRLLEQSEEVLATMVSLRPFEEQQQPLWYVLEHAIRGYITREMAVRCLAQVDAWTASAEIFAKHFTLRWDYHDSDEKKQKGEAELISIFADALHHCASDMKSFLEEWLEKVQAFDDSDWGFYADSQRIGIALLVLSRSGLLEERYYPLIRPYHEYVQFSRLPLTILAELLAVTSPKHQYAIVGEMGLYVGANHHSPDPSNSTNSPDNDDEKDEEWEDENDGTFSKVITTNMPAWILLKGCRGDWVVDKIRGAASKWWEVRNRYGTQVVGDAFPYALAVEMLRAQEEVEEELIWSLPRF